MKFWFWKRSINARYENIVGTMVFDFKRFFKIFFKRCVRRTGRSFWKKIFYDEHRILYLPPATNVLWNFKIIFISSRSESYSDDIPSV